MATERITIVITETGSLRVRRGLEDIGGSAQRSSAAVNKLKDALKYLGTFLAVGKIIQWADAWTSATGQIKVATQSVTEYTAVTDKLFAAAQRSNQSFSALTQVYSRAARGGKDLGASQQQIIQFTEAIGKAVSVQGVTTTQAAGSLTQLGQALGGGIVRAEEFNSVVEGTPYILQVAANNIEGASGSISKLRTMMLEGKLTSKVFFDGIMKGVPEIEANFASMSMTFGQGFTVIENSMIRFIGKLNESSGVGNAFGKLAIKLSEGLDWLGDNIDRVAGTLATLAASIATLKLGLFITSIVSAANGATLLSFALLKVRNALMLLNANPFVALATTVVALTGYLWTYGDTINAGIDKTTTMKDVLWALIEVGEEVYDSLSEFCGTAFDYMINVAETFYNWITGTTTVSTGKWAKDYEGFFQGTGQGFAGFARKVARTIDAIAGLLTGLGIGIVRVFQGLPEAISTPFKQAYNEVAKWVENMANATIDAENAIRRIAGMDVIAHITIAKAEVTTDYYNKYGQTIAGAMAEGFSMQGGYMEKQVNSLFDRAASISQRRIASQAKDLKAPDLNAPMGTPSPAQAAAKGAGGKNGSKSDGYSASDLNAPWLKGAEAFKDIIEEAAKRFNVDPRFVQAIIRQETGWMKNSQAQLTARSPAGARGVMQLMPATAAQVAKEIGLKKYSTTDAKDNIMMGTAYLSKQLARYGNDFKLAAASYNAGEGNMDKYRNKETGQYTIPPFKETRDYVANVTKFYESLARSSDTTTATQIENAIKLEDAWADYENRLVGIDEQTARLKSATANNLTRDEMELEQQAQQIINDLKEKGITLDEQQTLVLLKKLSGLQQATNEAEANQRALEEAEQKQKEIAQARIEYDNYLVGINRDRLTVEKSLWDIGTENRDVMNQVLAKQAEMHEKGIDLSDEQLNSLKDELTALHVLNEQYDLQNSILENSVKQRRNWFSQAEAIMHLSNNPDAGFTAEDKLAATIGLNENLFKGTQELVNNQLNLYKQYYQQIGDMRELDLISERTATQMRAQIAEQEAQDLRNLQIEAAQTRLQLGSGNWADVELASIGKLISGFQNFHTSTSALMGDFFQSFADGFANSIGRAIVYSEDLGTALMKVAQESVASLISGFVKLGIQWLVNQAISKTIATSATATTAATAASAAAAWAPAAALASLATMGANAAPASAALASTTALSSTLALTSMAGFKDGGYTGEYGVNQVAGFVHGKEFVMTAEATSRNRPILEAMNRGYSPTEGAGNSPVVNITVNVDANGNSTMTAENATAMSGEMTKGIESVVLNVLRKQSRQGGMVATRK